MSVLAGTEQVVLAADRPSDDARIAPGDAPDQRWGSARGRSDKASPDATDATAKGGRDGALKVPGELPPESRSVGAEFSAPAKPPAAGPVEAVEAPAGPRGRSSGFDAKVSKELAGKRDEQARTFQNQDGTYTTRFYDEPVNFRAADGKWKAIDTTLVRPDGARTMSGSEGAWETRSTENTISFAAYADADQVVRVGLGEGEGQSVGYAIEGAGRAQGKADGSVITYPGVRPSSDLELIAGSDSVKETLILKDEKAPTQWRFPLALEGLTARLGDQGNVTFVDAAGKQRAWMPAGWMEDSNLAENANEGVISSGVKYSLAEEPGGRQTLVVTLDEKWLSAPERVFPVRVDPSVSSVDATSGTYVEAPYNQNFSSDTVLKTGTYDGGGHKAAGFLRFSGLETTLKNAWVLNTNLALYNTWSQSCTARPVTVHPITSNWSESTTTKYPGPSTGSSLASKSFAHGWRPADTTTWSCAPKWESLKLGSAGRKLVDDWTHGRKKNYGLAVKASVSDSKGWKQFGSDDYPNGKPSLDVTWTKYGAAYELGDFVTPVTATAEGAMKVTVTNRGQQTWPAGGNFKLRYNLFDSAGKEITDSAKIRWTAMPSDISPGESVTLTAAIAPLTPATYTLQWTMDDVGVSRFTSAGVPGPAVKFAAVNVPPQLTAEAPGSGVTVDSLTPTVWAKGKDADGYPQAKLQYTFEVCEVSGSSTRKNCRMGTRGSSQQWAVPSGWLSWGKTYAWYAYVYDGKDTSARPGAALFTTQVPQPPVTGHLGGDGEREFSARAGNYATAATDAAMPTVGPQLSVDRTYNSLDPRGDTAFGLGWTSRWDMSLRAEPKTDTAVVTLVNGSRVRFGRNADGSYTGPSGGGMTLTRQGAGEYPDWVLRERSGTAYYISGYSGKLTSIVDGAGRAQALNYAQEGEGPLTSVTDEQSGRSLAFTWEAGHVSSVTTNAVGPDAPGLKWTYTYTGNRLSTVCPPSSTTQCTVYEYTDGSVYRSTVLDANPASYWRLGETEGAAAASEAPSRTGLNEAVHRDVRLGAASAIAGTTDTAAGFDGTDSYLELPADTLKAAAFPTVELWFKTTKSGVLLGFQNAELGDKPTSWRPVLNIDGAGKLRGEFQRVGVSGAGGPITSAQAVTDDTWHHAVLTASASGQTLYLDGAEVGSLDGQVSEQSGSYAYLGAGYSSTSWMGVAAGTYRFSGEMDEVAVYGHPLDAATVAEHYAARQAVGQVSKVTLPSGRVHATASYDTVSGRLTEHTDGYGGTWKVSAPSYSSASSSYENRILRTGPTGYWRLGERGGAQAQSPLGDALNGSYLDGVRPGSAGIFADGDDTSASFTGDGAVELPVESLGDGTSMSVELWFKTTEPGVLATMQNQELGEPPTGWRPMLVIDADGMLRGKFTPDASSIYSKEAVTDGKWHHVILTGNEGIQALFMDGVTQGTTRSGVDTVRHPHVYIGGGYASSGWDGQAGGYRNFTGQIDEVAFYDKPLVPFTDIGGSWMLMPWWETWDTTPKWHYQARNALVEGSGDQYRGVTVGDAPSAYWRLGETEGTKLASEVGGPEKAGSYHQDAGDLYYSSLGETGVFGPGDNKSVQLGSTGHAQVPGSVLAGTTDLAVEMWFRTYNHSAVLMSLQNAPLGQTPTSWRPLLNIDGSGKLRGEFYLAAGSGATPITSTQTVTDNKWHHVVLSGAGTTQSLYLDGVKVGSLSGAIAEQSRPYAYIGGGYGSSGWMGLPSDTYYFRGQVDEVALYRKALTEDQVAAHYRAQAAAAASGLTSTVKVTDPLGKTSSTSYDAVRGHRMVAQTDATGAVTSYAYDSGGFLHTITDPNGHSTVTGHDKRGNTVSTTTCRDADSCWTSFRSYYANADDPLDPRNDKPLTYRDQRSADHRDDTYRVSYTWNAQGLPTSTVRPDNTTAGTDYTYGTEAATGGGTVPAGLVASRKTPGGVVTSFGYYASGDLARVTSPSGLVTEFTYDGLGRKLTETQISDTYPDGVTTTYAYDTNSHVVGETGAAVRNEITGVTHTAKITRSYGPDGNLLTESTEDLTGGDTKRSSTHHYNANGLNDSVTDAEGNTTHYAHDTRGRVTRTTDAQGTVFAYAYTSRGQHAQTVLEDWTGHPSGGTRDLVVVSNAYDPAGRLASATDAMGATTKFTYFADGLPATTTAQQVTQADGTKRDIVLESNSYDPAGNLTNVVTGGGRTTVTRKVDALSRTERSTLDPNGLNRVTTYAYDSDDRVTEQTQSISGSKELTSTSEYDTAGRPKRQTITDGTSTHTTSQSYDARGLLLATVSPLGNTAGADASAHTATNRYDALGRLVEQTAPPVQAEENGGAAKAVKPATLTGYNTFGEATEGRDPKGAVTRTETDKLGRAVAVTLPDYTPPGGTKITAVTRTSYDALGRFAVTTDALGRATRYGYDQLGNLTSKTDPVAGTPQVTSLAESEFGTLNGESEDLDGAGVTRHTWTPTGLQLSATGPTGARAEATYDEIGRSLTSTTIERHPSVQNLTSRYTWDDAGNQIASTTPAGRTTTATHNPAGEVLTVTTPVGTTKFGYDGLGRQTETTDATGRRSTSGYDALGNVTASTDYGTGSTALRTASAEFDAAGNRTAAKSATGARSTYTFDALGRQTRLVEPVKDTASITTTFGYDEAGNRTRMTDGRGNSTTYTFNTWGLPESTVEPATAAHPAAVDRTWTTLYDAAGQDVAELLPGGVKRERQYDGLGRLTHETGTGAERLTTARTFGYDLAGRITTAGTDDIAVQNTYTYNDRGQVLSTAGHGGTNQYTYDADGQMTERTTGGNTSSYGYDSAGRMSWVWDESTGSDIWYGFDAAGRPKTEQYMVQPAGSTEWTEASRRTYGYDSLGRLTSDKITNPDGTQEKSATAYGYDLADRLNKKDTSGTAGAGTNTYGYDDSGRLTSWTRGSSTTVDYTWDAAGNRTKAGDLSATFDERNRQLADGTERFNYTARGTLSSVQDGAGTPRALAFDAFERKITDGASTFSYDSLDRVSEHNGTPFVYDGGSNNLTYDGTTTYSRTPGGALLATSDGTSAQWAVTDQHTDLVGQLSADGTRLTGSRAYDPFGTTTASEGTGPALGYQSGWTDPDSGDVNMSSRWYQPGTGGFASRDTWQLNPDPSVQGNRYTYANAAPLNGTDPSGHCLGPVVLICGGVAVGGAAAGWWTLGGVVAFGGGMVGWEWWNNGGSSGSSGFAESYTSGLTYHYASDLADSITGQAGSFSGSRGKGNGPNRDTVNWPTYRTSSHLGGGWAMGAGAGAGGGARVAVRPPRPPIDQNPNNGKNPRPAPNRPIPKPDWDPKSGGWKSDDGWGMVVGAARMLDLINGDESYTPDAVESYEPAPSAGGRSGTDSRRQSDCRRGGIGWREYGTRDAAHGNRATGVEACLDSAWLEANKGTEVTREIRPPGYKWAGRYARFLGLQPKSSINNCHLLGKDLSGSGTNLANLATCSRQANFWVAEENGRLEDNMFNFETQVKEAIDGGQVVHYSVTPKYYGPRTTAVSFEMSANGVNQDGSPGLQFDEAVPNSLYSRKLKQWRNLGTVTHNGGPIPTGGMR